MRLQASLHEVLPPVLVIVELDEVQAVHPLTHRMPRDTLEPPDKLGTLLLPLTPGGMNAPCRQLVAFAQHNMVSSLPSPGILSQCACSSSATAHCDPSILTSVRIVAAACFIAHEPSSSPVLLAIPHHDMAASSMFNQSSISVKSLQDSHCNLAHHLISPWPPWKWCTPETWGPVLLQSVLRMC